jgi:hypothetical protein
MSAFEEWQAAVREHHRVHKLHDQGKASDAERRRVVARLNESYEAWIRSLPPQPRKEED